MPRNAQMMAKIQLWLSVAAGTLAFGAAAARGIQLFKRAINPEPYIGRAHELLRLMDSELCDRQFLIGEEPTLADIAMYSYTARAPEGNVSLETYPHVKDWLSRIERLPGFVAMPKSPIGMTT